MFSELVESVPRPNDKRKKWAVTASIAAQAACLLTLIVIPLVYTQALPRVTLGSMLVLPSTPAAQPPKPTVPAGEAHSARLLHGHILIEPTSIPPTVNIFAEAELTPETVTAETGYGSTTNLFDLGTAPAEAVNRPAEPAIAKRVRLGGNVEDAKLLVRIQPDYPVLAVQTRTQGNVILHAIIGKEGEVAELQVVSGHPLLVKAALVAVQQWRYSPTLLNGLPVEVETTITVSFILGR
jgi:protein TonB